MMTWKRCVEESGRGRFYGTFPAFACVEGRDYGGVWRSLRLGGSGVRRSVLCWCVWQESGVCRREDFFHI
jgi:hypothetical protein